MGITRIDFGNDVQVGGKVKALQDSPSEGWLAEVLSVKYTKSKSSDNVGIEVTYKITDEKAVDIDGTPFTGKKQWDSFWFDQKSAKMTKLKLIGLGVDVDELVVENEADVQTLAEDLRDSIIGLEVSLVTETEENNYGNGEYWDGTQKYKSNVKFVNSVE